MSKCDNDRQAHIYLIHIPLLQVNREFESVVRFNFEFILGDEVGVSSHSSTPLFFATLSRLRRREASFFDSPLFFLTVVIVQSLIINRIHMDRWPHNFRPLNSSIGTYNISSLTHLNSESLATCTGDICAGDVLPQYNFNCKEKTCAPIKADVSSRLFFLSVS